MSFRIGLGYDVHRFEAGRELILGGVHIDFEKGLKGHSDADVLLHAITDALLGAAALGDIGTHFPDTDAKYKDADSALLLQKAYELVQRNGFEFVNADATIVAEKPKMSPYIDLMRSRISELLCCSASDISIKATTSEKMGFVGREEGIAVHGVVLIRRKG